MKEGEDITFDQILVNLIITEEDYISTIYSSLDAPNTFLKRNSKELRINNNNPICLSA